MGEPLKWYDANAKDNPAFLKALAEVRRIGMHEGWCSRVNCLLSMTHLLFHKTPNSVSSEPGAAQKF
jgi:hypothetical protein